MDPGKRLKAFRVTQGLSRAAAAEALRCDQSYIGLVERGKRRPGLELAHRIYDLTADWDLGPIETRDWCDGAVAEAS